MTARWHKSNVPTMMVLLFVAAYFPTGKLPACVYVSLLTIHVTVIAHCVQTSNLAAALPSPQQPTRMGIVNANDSDNPVAVHPDSTSFAVQDLLLTPHLLSAGGRHRHQVHFRHFMNSASSRSSGATRKQTALHLASLSCALSSDCGHHH